MTDARRVARDLLNRGLYGRAVEFEDRYGGDVLAGDWRRAGRPTVPDVAAVVGEVIEVPPQSGIGDGFVGEIVAANRHAVRLEDRHGRVREFPLGGGYLVDGRPVRLVAPTAAPARPARTASGSLAVTGARARTARGSRILVEGKHDAELVEKVWGDDLRVEGVVVELLDGVDRLEAWLDDFAPDAHHRVGVLVDHLVAGSKESRIAATVARSRHRAHTLVVGHPYVDVWQSVTPAALGIDRWPEVPRSIEWKRGVCRALGWPADTQADLARAWARILGTVSSYRELEPALLGRVEQLIDFVTADAA